MHDDYLIDPLSATCGREGDFLSNQFSLAVKSLTDSERKYINFKDISEVVDKMLNEKETDLKENYRMSNETLNNILVLIEKFNTERELMINNIVSSVLNEQREKTKSLVFQLEIIDKFIAITKDYIKEQ